MTKTKCPRRESNTRTRFRRALLYPLSYGGSGEGYRRVADGIRLASRFAEGRHQNEGPAWVGNDVRTCEGRQFRLPGVRLTSKALRCPRLD
jgi:hypothetical protein